MRLLFRFVLLSFRFIRRFATYFAVLALIVSLSFNVAMLTVSGVFAAAQGALSALGVSTLVAKEAGEKVARQNAARKIVRETGEKVTRRVQRGAARNIGSVFGEAVPVVGVSVIAGALVLEVKDACDTAADMAGLEAALSTEGDPEKAREEAVMTFDCPSMIRQQLPDYESLPTKEQLLSKINSYPQAALEQSSSFYEDLRSKDWAAELSNAQDDIASWYRSMIPQTNWQLPWQGDEGGDP